MTARVWRPVRLARFASTLSRDKADVLLLLAGALMVLAPHASHLPTWTSLACGVTLFWRAIITLRGLRMPPVALLAPVAAGAMVAVYLSYRTLLGRDAGVAMLVLLVTFKMLEMRARRDLFVVIFLCMFLVLTNFFYSQSIGTALMMVASVITLLTAQLSFQYTGATPSLARRLRLGASIVALAAPLALLLFVVFPRIQGPLWGMPGDARSGRAGLSERMEPGSLSSLALSDDVAFRVKFIDPAPSQEALYWRGLVLGQFDGRSWTRSAAQKSTNARNQPQVVVRGEGVRYQVTLEPSGNHWLFALEVPDQLPQLENNPSAVSSALELESAHQIDDRVRYSVRSFPNYSLQADASRSQLFASLLIPVGSNERSRALGARLRMQGDPAYRIGAALQMFRNQAFVYTLEPPLLGEDPVDQFLFTTRAGFCEHYAGAFVFLMRAAGVPARVVTGYQGGEVNPVDAYLTVRQSDAHAWAEVWMQERGWVRVDPTAAVAPERVRRNLAQAIPRRPPFGIEGLGNLLGLSGDNNSWVAQLRYKLAAINNAWNQYVLNYTPQRQQSVLESLQVTLMNARMLAALCAIGALLWLMYVLRARGKIDPVDALYAELCGQLARRGLTRAADEGPQRYAERIVQAELPAPKRAAIVEFLALVSRYKYAPAPSHANLVGTLKTLLTQSR